MRVESSGRVLTQSAKATEEISLLVSEASPIPLHPISEELLSHNFVVDRSNLLSEAFGNIFSMLLLKAIFAEGASWLRKRDVGCQPVCRGAP